MKSESPVEEARAAGHAASLAIAGGLRAGPDNRAPRDQVLALFALFERLPGLVAVTGHDGELMFLNATGRSMLDLGRTAALAGRSLLEHYTGASRDLLCKRGIPAAVRNGIWYGETALAGPDGQTLPLWQVTVHLGGGSGAGFLFTLAWDFSSRKDQERSLWHQATHDALTGLPNRALLMDRLTQAIHGAQRTTHFTAVLLLDLDGFKEVNDRYGHETGNRLLSELAVRLYACVRAGDTIGRYGGDEFVCILCELNDSDEVLQVQRRIHAALAEPFVVGDAILRIGASIGAAIHPDDGSDAPGLLARADRAMYRAKESRKTRPSGAPRPAIEGNGPAVNRNLVLTP